MKRPAVPFALLALVCALALAGATATRAIAQEDRSPNPEECTWEQTTVAALQALYGTPAPEGAGEETSAAQQATPEATELPAGEPADDAAIQEIESAIRGFFACNHAGNFLAALSHVTEDMVRDAIGENVYDEDLIAAFEAAPVALAEELQTEILGFSNHLRLPDGRLGALIHYIAHTGEQEGINGIEADFMILERVGEELHLDETIQNLESLFPPEDMGTPAAG